MLNPSELEHPADYSQMRHRCSGGHQRLIARVVNGQLEFQCDGCKEKYYWSSEFLVTLAHLVKTNNGFLFVFE